MAYKEETTKENSGISQSMKNKILKYFKELGGIDDLRLATSSAKMVGDDMVIYSYPNSSIDEYYRKHVKKFDSGNFTDSFESYAKCKYKDKNGKMQDTGRFIPAMFWDYALNLSK